MHPHVNKISLYALCALAAMCSSAHAATSTAKASIEQFHIELVDLDLTDGVTPSLFFTQQSWGVDSVGDAQRQVYTVQGKTSITTSFGATGGSASDSTLSSSASVNHPAVKDGKSHQYTTNSYRITNFTLSPHTQMIITALGSVSENRLGVFDSSVARIAMRGKLLDESGDWVDSFSKSYQTDAGSTTLRMYASLSTDEFVRSGNFDVVTQATLAGQISSVPEPSAYAMLLAGTVLVGAMARRRRRTPACNAA
ncbi:PEP-CTERM sorting domain-containing protein [Massilia rubra]|nr:PEP-CTERM sorting domain-containing protein [Massilia rubra]